VLGGWWWWVGIWDLGKFVCLYFRFPLSAPLPATCATCHLPRRRNAVANRNTKGFKNKTREKRGTRNEERGTRNEERGQKTEDRRPRSYRTKGHSKKKVTDPCVYLVNFRGTNQPRNITFLPQSKLVRFWAFLGEGSSKTRFKKKMQKVHVKNFS
jgi:hypothetical protein